MIINKHFRRVLSGIISAAMLLTMSAPPLAADLNAGAASVCTVNTNKTYQRIRGFGGMNLLEWQGYDLTDANIQTAFGTGEGQLGLTVMRIYVSDNQNDWSKCIPAAKKAQAMGATIFATPWNPLSSMRRKTLPGSMTAVRPNIQRS